MRYENTLIRRPTPSYADDMASENALSATLQVESHQKGKGTDYFMDQKFNYIYGSKMYPSKNRKEERKTFAFWTVIIVLILLAVGNLILTLSIFCVLHIGKGLLSLEVIPEERMVKFYGSTDLDKVYNKQSAQIEGFSDLPVTIDGKEGVYVRLHKNGLAYNRLVLDRTGIQFRGFNTFEVKDTSNGATIFTTHRPHYNMPTGAENLVAKCVGSSRIASPINRPLNFEADGRVYFKGSEGISLDSESAFLQSQSYDMIINSTEGDIMLEDGTGVFLNMDKIPIVSNEFGLRTGSIQYKICVCMPKGNLFRVPVPRLRNGPKVTCGHFNAHHDPCAAN